MAKKAQGSAAPGKLHDLLTSWTTQRPDLDLDDFLLGIVLNRVGRMLETAFDRMCRAQFAVSGPDMRVLFALRRIGAPYALRPTDLFRGLLVTSGAMTKQVDRLQAFGMVERTPDPEHGGGFKVVLTDWGLEVANTATEAMATQSLLSSALPHIPEDVRESGKLFIYQLLDALEYEVTANRNADRG